MAKFGLTPAGFSVLALIVHNAGITSSELCVALDLQPPNLVGILRELETRKLIFREPHRSDGRSKSLHASATGKAILVRAGDEAKLAEAHLTRSITPTERQLILKLLRKTRGSQ